MLLILTAAMAAAGILLGLLRYRTLINPLTFFVGIEVLLQTFLSALVMLKFRGDVAEPGVIATTLALSLCYHAGVFIPFLFNGPLPAAVFSVLVSLLGLGREPRFTFAFKRYKFLLILACTVGFFILLASASGVGRLWLINPRKAYQFHRSGVGYLYASALWLFMFAYIYYLWTRRPRGLWLLTTVFCFSGLALFSGSKAYVLSFWIVAVIYRQFRVRPVAWSVLVLTAILGAGLLVVLQLLQGTALSLRDAIAYFDFFPVTTMFISRSEEFESMFGRAWLSSLWSYIPRSLVPQKPFEYGALLINRVLFPGAAMRTHTPALLSWSLPYLDFGVIGVLLAGWLKGIRFRMVYEYYLLNRNNIFGFQFMLQFSVLPVYFYAPFGVFILLLILQALFLRLGQPRLFVARRVQAQAQPDPSRPRTYRPEPESFS